jgi:hypothetical protein
MDSDGDPAGVAMPQYQTSPEAGLTSARQRQVLSGSRAVGSNGGRSYSEA